MNSGSIRFWFIPCKMKVTVMYGLHISAVGKMTLAGMIRMSLRATCCWSAGAACADVPKAAWATTNARTPTLKSECLKRGLIADTFLPPWSHLGPLISATLTCRQATAADPTRYTARALPMEDSLPLRVALVGMGRIGRAHLRALSATP